MKKAFAAIAALAALLLALFAWKLHKSSAERIAEEKREAPEPVLQAQTRPALKELVERYEDGTRKSVRHVRESDPKVREGVSVEFYRSGRTRSETNFSNDEPNGRFRLYSEDGEPALEGTLKAGQRDGRFTEWHPGGRVKLECGYKNGLLDGAWTEYYDADGSPKKIEANYRDGALAGRYAAYKLDGLVKEERFYGQLPRQGAQAAQGEDAGKAAAAPHDCSDTPISDPQPKRQ